MTIFNKQINFINKKSKLQNVIANINRKPY